MIFGGQNNKRKFTARHPDEPGAGADRPFGSTREGRRRPKRKKPKVPPLIKQTNEPRLVYKPGFTSSAFKAESVRALSPPHGRGRVSLGVR